MMAFSPPRPLSWFFFLLVLGMLLALGSWQVQRLQWKEGLIAELETANALEPHDWVSLDAEAPLPLFQRFVLKGQFAEGVEYHVTPRHYKGALGYHVFVPFTLADGNIVMVNRGWVPFKQKEPASRPGSDAPKGAVTLTAQLREGAEHSRFTPDSQPAKNIWFGRDIAGMKRSMTDFPHADRLRDDMSFDVVGEEEDAVLPVPSDGKVTLRNDHLQYAITWFSLAFIWIIVFTVYHHRKGAA